MSLSSPKNPPILNESVASEKSAEVLFSADENQTRLNQIHGINVNNQIGAGIPKQVSNVRVSIGNAQTGATCTISVLYSVDPTDTSFSGVNIWARGYQGNAQLVQVSSGTGSPTKFVLNSTGETVSFTIQAFGNGGNAPLNQSPTSSAVLPKSTAGGFGSSTVVSYNPNNPQPINVNWLLQNRFHVIVARGDGVNGFPASPGVYAINAAGNFSPTATETTGRLLTAPATASTQGQIAVYGDSGANPGQGFISLGTTAYHKVRILPQVSSGTRYWVGIFDNPSGGFGGTAYCSDTPNNKYVGFRFSAGTDTTWKCIAGTSNIAQTIVDSGVSLSTSASTEFALLFTNGGATCTFFINDLPVGVITTNLPAASYNINNAVLADNKNTNTAQSLVFFWAMTIMTK